MKGNRILKTLIIGVLSAGLMAGCSAKSDYTYTGTLEAEQYTISSEIGGEIIAIYADSGDAVAKGDLLAEIDASVLELEIKRLEANAGAIEAQLTQLIKGARSEELNQIYFQIQQQNKVISTLQQQYDFALDQFEDNKLLHEKGAISDQKLRELELAKDTASHSLAQAREQKSVLRQQQSLLVKGATEEEVQTVQSQLDAANWAIEAARDKMDQTQIVATVDGVVDWVQYNAGEIYRPLTPMMTVMEDGPLWAKIFVEEKYLYMVKLGDQLDVIIPHMEEPLKGKVIYIATQGEFTPKNTESRENRQEVVYEVQLQLQEEYSELKPGMLIDVRLNGVGS